MGKKQSSRHLKKPPGQFHHGDLRSAAVAVAVRQIEALGHDHVALSDIAKELGVTRPALYRHFADRRALLHEAAQSVFIAFEAAITDAFFAESEPWDALRAVAFTYLRFAVAHRGWFRLQFSSTGDDRPTPDLEAAPARYFPAMLDLFGELYGEEPHQAEQRYLMLWAQMHGAAMLAVEQIFGMPDDQTLAILEGTIQLFFDELQLGVRARGR